MKSKQNRTQETGPEAGPSNFEAALARLEAIVGEMEGGAQNLEETIARFEEGQKLIAFCGAKLNEVERKIEILMKKGDKMEPEPFGEGLPELGEGAQAEPGRLL